MTGSNGGNEAEQIVHIAFQGMELALKLTGSATKNLAQLIYSMSKDDKNLNMRSGEVKNVQQLLKENKPLQTYKIDMDDVSQFKKLGKQYGVLYTIVRDAKSEDGMCTVILKEEEVPMLNNILLDMGLKGARPISEQDSKKKEARSKDSLGDMTKSTGTKIIDKKKEKPSVLGELNKHKESIKTPKVKLPKKEITR